MLNYKLSDFINFSFRNFLICLAIILAFIYFAFTNQHTDQLRSTIAMGVWIACIFLVINKAIKNYSSSKKSGLLEPDQKSKLIGIFQRDFLLSIAFLQVSPFRQPNSIMHYLTFILSLFFLFNCLKSFIKLSRKNFKFVIDHYSAGNVTKSDCPELDQIGYFDFEQNAQQYKALIFQDLNSRTYLYDGYILTSENLVIEDRFSKLINELKLDLKSELDTRMNKSKLIK